MKQRPRIYLDNAATTWPKPQSVYEVVDDYQRRLGATVSRGGYSEAEEVAQLVAQSRSAVAGLIGAEAPERVIFTFNGTDSLNIAIHGILKPSDHVITTVVEHNSVLRPLRRLEKALRIKVTRVGCNAAGIIDPNEIRTALRPETKLIIVTHASNVTGAIQPVSEISRIARQHGILFLVDAAQTLGHLPLSVAEIGADLLAAPGHKGLLGPLGTGILYVRPGVERLVDSTRQGGTGSASSSDEQSDSLPEKYESGNLNVPGIIGMGEGIRYLQSQGIEALRAHSLQLTTKLHEQLEEIHEVSVIGPKRWEERTGIVSCVVSDTDSPAFARHLDELFRVQTRAGFHCASSIHQHLGTKANRGTIRFSVGPFNNMSDVIEAAAAVKQLKSQRISNSSAHDCPCVGAGGVKVDLKDFGNHSGIAAAVTACAETVARIAPAIVDRIPGLNDAWAQTTGDPTIRIAILDGPIDQSHPELVGAHIRVIAAANKPALKGYAAKHGTHVTSIIFGQHQGNVRGIAPGCEAIVIPIFHDGADGLVSATQQRLATAVEAAIEAGAHIINISAGEPSPAGIADPALRNAISKCEEMGILVVAAAGNAGCDNPDTCSCMHVPAAFPTVLAVGAMDDAGAPLSTSNCGAGYQQHGILAPGKNIVGATPPTGTATLTGTSFAAPLVTGIAGLLLSIQVKNGVAATPLFIRDVLLHSAEKCNHSNESDCRRVLAGRLNLPNALSLVLSGDPLMSDKEDMTLSGCGCNTTQHSPLQLPEEEQEQRHRRSLDQSVRSSETQHNPADRSARARPSRHATPHLTPSGCIAESDGQLVYVIGNLMYDFGTTGNLESLRNNIPSPKDFGGTNLLDITTPFGLMAYLLGYQAQFRASTTDCGCPDPADEGIASPNDGPSPLPELITRKVCGNMHDAAYVTWVLAQNNCPKYAIKPQGAYQEAGYLEIIRFVLEQYDFLKHVDICCKGHVPVPVQVGDLSIVLNGDCLTHYYQCHGGIVCPCDAVEPPTDPDCATTCSSSGDPRRKTLRQRRADRRAGRRSAAKAELELDSKNTASNGDCDDDCETQSLECMLDSLGLGFAQAQYVAIAGEFCGTKKLFNGKELPVISPAMRSCSSWNTLKLLEQVAKKLCIWLYPEEAVALASLVLTMAEGASNDGITPEERAFNFSSTLIIETLAALIANPIFLQVVTDPIFPDVVSIGFDGWTVEPAKCRESDTLPYDVTLIFYNVNTLRPSRVFVTFQVNVADVNPVGHPPRLSIRR